MPGTKSKYTTDSAKSVKLFCKIPNLFCVDEPVLQLTITKEDDTMARAMTPENRIKKARALIEEARKIEKPQSVGWEFFSYTANVKDTLRKAFELVKLINHSPATPEDVKADARAVIEEISQAELDILGKKSG